MSEARPLALRTKLLMATFLVFLIVIAVSTVRLAFYGNQQKEDKQVAQAGQAAEQQDKKDLAAEVKKVCDAGGAPAKKLADQGLCGKAKEIIQEPTKTVEPGLNETQVRKVVEEEVARRNLTLSPSQINTVATVAASKVPKPKDGKTPTNAQIQPLVSAAVATFCANDACRGKDGANAPAVTREQLAATLTAYCEPRNGCIGADGNEGPTGAKGPRGYGLTVITTPDTENNGTVVTFKSEDPDVKDVSFFVANGKQGVKGEPGYPFTFIFSVPGALPADPATTYSCTVTGPEAADTTCTKQ